MKDKLFLSGYLILVILITSYHHISFLAGLLIILFLLSGTHFPRLLKKSLFSIVLFSSVITIAYIIVSTISSTFSLEYIVLINLRVLLLSFMTFLVIERINLFKALSFSRTLTTILVLATTQALAFKKIYEDCKFAFKSRTLGRTKNKDIYSHISSVIFFFLNKTIHGSREITQAMRSRGFFYD